jgi:hypothetical protein
MTCAAQGFFMTAIVLSVLFCCARGRWKYAPHAPANHPGRIKKCWFFALIIAFFVSAFICLGMPVSLSLAQVLRIFSPHQGWGSRLSILQHLASQ